MRYGRCDECGGLGFVDCDDPIQCLRRECDGELHDCRTCRGAGDVEIEEDDDA